MFRQIATCRFVSRFRYDTGLPSKTTGKAVKIHHVLDIKGGEYLSITLVKMFGPKSHLFS